MSARVEHVAVYVSDFDWHISFFQDALGMEITEIQERQIWIGGLQLTHCQDYAVPPTHRERVWHIGIQVPNIDDARSCVAAYPGVRPFSTNPDQANWFRLPEGLVIELVQQHNTH